ncbi:aminotransferase, class V [Enterococcus haemoperoxidus ATCC BAA-382]|uniref:cysteine desulfurase n=1 Tax=Enterococcus haemoperoxidus ATCC BAA-382 TaxID=1158608 RepID=R2SIV0_9ENTE|nr:cysteine desulfurase family protein [Enterococcus haemoperoxidus]EOH92796.1 aminotransferase, class V [Enterococcus haemoperoxidus ATCC BAA-382]EOT61539.1 aminotransferase, class V [Enterococcus haemoperoxidus ATCC BAA-382]OJG55372.1 aminotransferase, class V [Enterococcus haemoperoxidus]
MEPIYLDHAATTPTHPAVIEIMASELANTFGNPSSIHTFGRKAHRALEDIRQVIATSLKVKPHEIIFNSGGTEGDNTAIIETALSRKAQGMHLITTAIEHPAVLETMKYLEGLGFEVTYLPVDEHGELAMTDLENALREDTTLVSVMYGNNEIGNLLPIKEIGELLKIHPAVFHTDAVQAYGSELISPHELGVDLLSIAAHKINGPKGVGFLFKNDAISLPSFLHGGEQEEKRRAGTENLAGIAGMGKAVELLTESEKQRRHEKYAEFERIILTQLDKAQISYQINGNPENKLAHILNLRFLDVPSDLLLMHLDLQGVAISTGSACTAGTVDPSHVLEAMYGKNHPAIKESVRISFGLGNDEEQIQRFTAILIETIQKIKQ